MKGYNLTQEEQNRYKGIIEDRIINLEKIEDIREYWRQLSYTGKLVKNLLNDDSTEENFKSYLSDAQRLLEELGYAATIREMASKQGKMLIVDKQEFKVISVNCI